MNYAKLPHTSEDEEEEEKVQNQQQQPESSGGKRDFPKLSSSYFRHSLLINQTESEGAIFNQNSTGWDFLKHIVSFHSICMCMLLIYLSYLYKCFNFSELFLRVHRPY